MFSSKLKWSVLLFASSLVLLWRLIDFAYEVADRGFYITRGGLALNGSVAEAIEVAIILSSIVLIWKAITNLLHLHLTDSSR